MSIKHRRRWRIVRGYVAGWVAAFLFLSVFRGAGTTEEGSAQFGLGMSLALSLPFGLVLGGLAGFAQVLIEERLYRRVPLLALLAARTGLAAAFLALMIMAAYATVKAFFGISMGLGEFALEPGSLAIYLYVLVVDVLLVTLRQVDLMLGEGNLTRVIRGAFYTPKEEERVFLFLDLRSSTALAEGLGHVQYSMLIQDCFDDLGVVTEHDAQVYQYVGDGVVLSWSTGDALRDHNCLAAFFRFRERLASRGAHYLQAYRCEPVFTGGAHVGTVTVTEVGRFKREIAYHGDAINTAARIQGRCHELGEDLLVSNALLARLPKAGPVFAALGDVRLKGKAEPVPISAVRAAAVPPPS